ncbi:MAG: hypothetical protein HQ518_28375 [Rhodopirellula sp.]|nr:hypothetical protein [Rhodopirellula sp.]
MASGTNGSRLFCRQQLFPKRLQKAGYQTAIVGKKWHPGHGGISDPQGFDFWDVLQRQRSYYTF